MDDSVWLGDTKIQLNWYKHQSWQNHEVLPANYCGQCEPWTALLYNMVRQIISRYSEYNDEYG